MTRESFVSIAWRLVPYWMNQVCSCRQAAHVFELAGRPPLLPHLASLRPAGCVLRPSARPKRAQPACLPPQLP